MKKKLRKIKENKEKALSIGEAVVLVDEYGSKRDALVQIIESPESVHVLFIDNVGHPQEVHSIGLEETTAHKEHYERV